MKKHYPMKTFHNMYHIGTLNAADKKRNSHEEAEGNEIQKMKRFIPLKKMKEKTKSDVDLVLSIDLLCTLFAEEVLEVDGVWWQDRLDVSRYSAPRGVIVPSKMNTWTFQKENKKDFIN